ncbi:MAG: hypothetical protein EHM93_19785 [Bacteroidales bacterium]|nr:MAG: hypothetical protein EHM93_19785 [Bacteroidales bacterium]
MEYHEVEGEITNKVNLYAWEYELNNYSKLVVSSKGRKFYFGELQQYEYLKEQFERAKRTMLFMGSSNYFDDSMLWMRGKKLVDNAQTDCSSEEKIAGRNFFQATKRRREFLFKLESSVTIARMLRDKILENPANKVLIFSELTEQANKISANVIHSKVASTVKKSDELNKVTLDKFNSGVIRDIASCNSLTSGVNLIGCNYVIVESFNSSDVKSNQIRGRLRRLGLEDEATMIVIVPKNTQAETWFRNGYGDMDYKVIKSFEELKI